MENPDTWGPVEHTIAEAYAEWIRSIELGRAGLSLPMTVGNALRNKGLVEVDAAVVWEEAAEAISEWMWNNPSPSGIPHDPPRNPYDD